jgi:hypothetical protein
VDKLKDTKAVDWELGNAGGHKKGWHYRRSNRRSSIRMCSSSRQGQNVARQGIPLKAGIPRQQLLLLFNKVCGSGLRAVSLAAQIIKAEMQK